ncbi:MAG TPA: DNA repair protein RecN [Micropepsaceae bacterium]|jgi:DNA repair protein RecN (Recombination protein N)|nr:DNA repair protein RecN [Micropepsaceae bacterium]
MLTSLIVRDIVLIEKAELQFAPGLNVLTGETGAGKSILLDALGLAAGERGVGRAAIRVGADQAAVAAIFEIERDHPACAILKANALGDQSGEIMLRRTVTADGRSRAYVNDQPVGVQLAREMGAALLEVHGQTDDRGLFDVATHRMLLDAFGGHIGLAEDVAHRYEAVAASAAKRDALQKAQTTAAQELDYLTHAAKELADLAPEPGEEDALAATRALLTNAGRLAQEIAAAADFVMGDAGAEVRLSAALRRLSRLPAEGRKAASAAETALDSALALVQEARSELEALAEKLAADPGKLEQVEERLFALRAATRKYNVPVDALARLRDEFEAKLTSLGGGDASIAAAEAELAGAQARYREGAADLSARRARAAKSLEDAVGKELAPLKLGSARFRVALTSLPEDIAGANGAERVAFEIATIEGAAFGPLAKIASGGELARFALALKVALAEASPPAVLVFDEVDRGVGGAVAAAVGERLQRLAETTQVLLVTHSPQVAARAARHFRITRTNDATRVTELSAEDRVEEIARMLSGAAVTDEARAAARRLVSEAQAQAKPKKRVRA